MDDRANRAIDRVWSTLNPLAPVRDPLLALFHPYAYGQGEDFDSRLRATEFVWRLPPTVARLASPYLIRDWTVGQAAPSGLYLEFGVAGGLSTNQIARSLRRRIPEARLYGFDTFEGLPEPWRTGVGAGEYAQSELPRVEPNVTLVEGRFEETLVPFLRHHERAAAFVHIDCDLYSSTRFVLSTLLKEGRLRGGSILLFDELFNYPGWHQNGEYRALVELFPTKTLRHEFIAVTPFFGRAAVRLVDLGPVPAEESTPSTVPTVR